jgi:hypothetical protein
VCDYFVAGQPAVFVALLYGLLVGAHMAAHAAPGGVGVALAHGVQRIQHGLGCQVVERVAAGGRRPGAGLRACEDMNRARAGVAKGTGVGATCGPG